MAFHEINDPSPQKQKHALYVCQGQGTKQTPGTLRGHSELAPKPTLALGRGTGPGVGEGVKALQGRRLPWWMCCGSDSTSSTLDSLVLINMSRLHEGVFLDTNTVRGDEEVSLADARVTLRIYLYTRP